jgi:hypothetical protein
VQDRRDEMFRHAIDDLVPTHGLERPPEWDD